MRSQKLGKNISDTEVLGVSGKGVWMLVRDEEYFLDFKRFPWFREAPIAKVWNVELVHSHHLYWPDLDIDLELESLTHPENYPLLAR